MENKEKTGELWVQPRLIPDPPPKPAAPVVSQPEKKADTSTLSPASKTLIAVYEFGRTGNVAKGG